MQSSCPTFSPPSTVPVSIFSCKVIKKKDNWNTCIALLATEKRVEQNTIHKQQNNQPTQQKNFLITKTGNSQSEKVN